LYQATQPQAGSPFAPEDYWQQWTLPTANGELRLQSVPGAFAHGRLDKGTALLLEFLQSPAASKLKIKGKVMDFGCGVGVIGLVLKHRHPGIELEMLDTSASALESARASLELNGYEAKVVAADGLDGIKGRFDWIISNPPFHRGVDTDLNIAQRMIARAPALLGNRGRMLLVVNRHLPYEAWLAESFNGQEKVTENREFKVLLAHGSRLAGRGDGVRH
jgi:16S rRNA (guanine1207-N2)-methyltransferase